MKPLPILVKPSMELFSNLINITKSLLLDLISDTTLLIKVVMITKILIIVQVVPTSSNQINQINIARDTLISSKSSTTKESSYMNAT
jgi:hypothetical protein